jgi:hypothetical protein
MSTFSIWQLFTLAIIAVLVLMPVGKILSRVGYSPWLAILWVVPFVNIIMLWMFAFGRWPRDIADQARPFQAEP